MTPVSSISLILPLNCSSKCTGTGLYGICRGGTLGSSRIWYGSPGNLPIPVNTEGYSLLMSCFDLMTPVRVLFVVYFDDLHSDIHDVLFREARLV